MSKDPFKAVLTEAGGRLALKMSGELTLEGEDALMAAFQGVTLTGRPPLVLDFAAVPYVNSAGITVLLGLIQGLRDKSGEISFTGLNKHIEKVFKMTGFSNLVKF
ncbi:MAG: STAS domain-containing protein [Candidatus Riflebacteria bacterium]|nr:STAS domain-containing protein [Candidatus Riflebacteria bacterium]